MYRILYVDDEPALLELGKLFLERSGEFSVDTALSGSAGLTLLDSVKFDAIISDYQMPGMDGIGFLKKVRASSSTIPFIIFTGRSREEIVIQALNEGADFYLQKGGESVSQFTELAHKIRQAVQQRHAEASIRDHERREADIINFLPDATFAIDRSGHIIAWNRAIEEMTGVPATDMLGKGDYEYAIPFYTKRQPILIDLIYESDEVIARNYAHIIREKDTLIADTTLPHPKGNPVTLMGKAGPLYNRQGEIVGAIESIRDITGMKKAEERLSESEGRFAAFMDHLPVTAFIKDEQSTNIFVNRRMVEIFGTKEWIGKSVYEQFPKDAAEKMIEEDQQTIRDGYRKVIEFLIDKNGNKKIYETHKFRIDRENKPPLIGGFAIDITEQKESEDALSRSQARFRELTDLLPQIVYEADNDGNLTYANRIAFERFGYTEDEFRQGLNIIQMIAPRDRERAKETFREMVAGKKRTGPADEYLALRKDGSTYPIAISSSPVLVEGRITGLRGILVDITERKQGEKIIRESEEKYRSILDALPYAVSVMDRELKVIFANISLRSWLRILGSSDDIIGRPLLDAFPFLSVKVLDEYRDVFSNGTLIVTEETSTIGNRKIITETRKIPLWEHGDIVAVVAIIRDVTDRRMAGEDIPASGER
jgi:PAS domain S-box-containing protein